LSPRVYEGFGKKTLLSFTVGFCSPDGETNASEKFPDYYQTIEDFDAENTADIEYEHLYAGRNILKYRNRTKSNLIDLGRSWRDRVSAEYPDSDLTIVVHQNDGEWILDTFNYKIEIDGATYL